MERVVLEATGWNTPLRYERTDGAPRAPRGSEVLVEVGACGVAHRDLIDRSGRMRFMALPIVQGHEFAGRVAAVGPDVKRWEVGDAVAALHRDHCGTCPRCLEGETGHCGFAMHVFGITADGGYASHVLCPQTALYPVPEHMPTEHAAVLNSTFGTAFRALNRFGGLGPGDRVLITGANGGVGLAGIQVATRQGAEVVAVVRHAEHEEFVREMGAAHVLVDDGSTFHKRLPGAPVDVVLDCVGSPTFNSSLRSVRLGGGVGLVGNVEDHRVEVNCGRIVTGDVRLCGSTGATPTDLARLLALHDEHPLDFRIAHRLPLAEAERAQLMLRAGGLRGRIVLVPGSNTRG